MGDTTQSKAWEEIGQWIGKAIVWLFYIAIGVIAKLAFDSRTNPLSKRQIVVKTILSIFVGFIAAIFCENFGYEKWGKVIVPVATLVGEGGVVYLMANWKKILVNWLPTWAQKIFKK